MSDPVEHPSHYTAHPSGVECITVTEHMNFCRGNAIKYLWRAGEKGSELEDLRKARWYIDREIARIERTATVSSDEKVASDQADLDVKPISYYRTMDADFATAYFGFPMWGDGTHIASDGGKWVWDSDLEHWELMEYGTAEKPAPRSWTSLDQVPHDVVVRREDDGFSAMWGVSVCSNEPMWRWQHNSVPVPGRYHSDTWTEVSA